MVAPPAGASPSASTSSLPPSVTSSRAGVCGARDSELLVQGRPMPALAGRLGTDRGPRVLSGSIAAGLTSAAPSAQGKQRHSRGHLYLCRITRQQWSRGGCRQSATGKCHSWFKHIDHAHRSIPETHTPFILNAGAASSTGVPSSRAADAASLALLRHSAHSASGLELPARP